MSTNREQDDRTHAPDEQTLYRESDRGHEATVEFVAPVDSPLYTKGDMYRLLTLLAVIRTDAPGPCGSDIVRAIRALDEPEVPGSVYPALDTHREAGYIAAIDYVRAARYRIDDAAAVDAELAEHEQRLRWLCRLVSDARANLDTE